MKRRHLWMLMPLLLCLTVILPGCGNPSTSQPIQLTPAEAKLSIQIANSAYTTLNAQVQAQHAAGKLTGVKYDGAEAGLAALQQYITDATTANAAGNAINASAFTDSFFAAAATFAIDYLAGLTPTPVSTTLPSPTTNP